MIALYPGKSCGEHASETVCTDKGPCVFPFMDGNVNIFKVQFVALIEGGTSHTECKDYYGRDWCPTTLNDDCTYDQWGYCQSCTEGNYDIYT